MIDGSNTAPQAEVQSAGTTSNVEHAAIIIHRDFAPTAASSLHHAPTTIPTCSSAFGQKTDYRLAFEYGQPIRLDVSYDKGGTWQQGVAIAQQLGNVEGVPEIEPAGTAHSGAA